MHDRDLEAIVRSRQLLQSKHYELRIAQAPADCKCLATKEKARGAKWPLDPPPVIELILHDGDAGRSYLHSPFWFCTVTLETVNTIAGPNAPKGLAGTTVSSLHRVKLNDSKERGFFIFGDLNIRNPGTHYLKFSLFEMRQGLEGSQHMVAELLGSVESRAFRIFPQKHTMSIRESTLLSRQLCEAGVKLRIRKEHAAKRKNNNFSWAADQTQALPGGLHSLPRPMMTPMSRVTSGQHTVPSNNAGTDVRHRLSLSNQGSLGIRDYLENSSLKTEDASTRNTDTWATRASQHTPQQMPPPATPQHTTQQPTQQAQTWNHTNWSYGTGQSSSTYSMPPTVSSYELSSGRTSYHGTSYHNPQYTMAQSSYTLNPTSHSQPEYSGLGGGSDGSIFVGNPNPFSQTQSSDTGSSRVDNQDSGNVQQAGYGHLFSTSAGMATGGLDSSYGYQSMGEGSRGFPVTSGGDAGDHFS